MHEDLNRCYQSMFQSVTALIMLGENIGKNAPMLKLEMSTMWIVATKEAWPQMYNTDWEDDLVNYQLDLCWQAYAVTITDTNVQFPFMAVNYPTFTF